MGWVRTEMSIPRRFGTLIFPRDQFRSECERALSLSPEEAEEIVKGIIVKVRPELSGLLIMRMGFDIRTMAFEVVAAHESFEPVPDCCECRRMHLLEGENDTERVSEVGVKSQL